MEMQIQILYSQLVRAIGNVLPVSLPVGCLIRPTSWRFKTVG